MKWLRSFGLVCLWRGQHSEEERQSIGGSRCGLCGLAIAGEEYVSPTRRVYKRDAKGRHELTRTQAWAPDEQGQW